MDARHEDQDIAMLPSLMDLQNGRHDGCDSIRGRFGQITLEHPVLSTFDLFSHGTREIFRKKIASIVADMMMTFKSSFLSIISRLSRPSSRSVAVVGVGVSIA